jgi:hypothetical protein
MTITDPAARDGASVPHFEVARIGVREDHGAMNMQQPSRRVIAEPVSQPSAPKPPPAPKPPVAREVPPTARSEPVGSS